MRDCLAVALNSVTLLSAFPGYGMPVNGVLMSPLTARWRQTDSAAKNPPGVSVMPLMWIAVGASAALVSCAVSATVVLRASLLAFRSLTAVFSVAAVDFTSTIEMAASLAFVPASVALALAAAAASRASSI